MADTRPKEQPVPPVDLVTKQKSRDELDKKFPEVIANSVTQAQGGPPYLPQDARASADTTFADMIGGPTNTSSTEGLQGELPESHKPLRIPGMSLNAQSALGITNETGYTSSEAGRLGIKRQNQREEDRKRFADKAREKPKAA